MVDVPSWIKHPPVSQLRVVFDDRAKSQLESIAASDPCKEMASLESSIGRWKIMFLLKTKEEEQEEKITHKTSKNIIIS